MNEPKFTKGEWKQHDLSDATVVSESGRPVCFCGAFSDNAHGEENAANAQLIAASKNLYFALQKALPYLKDWQAENVNDPTVGIFEDRELTDAYGSAMNALAKSNGEAFPYPPEMERPFGSNENDFYGNQKD